MTTWLEKLKKAAEKAGREGARNPHLLKAAQNVKATVEAFKEGYRRQMEPEKHKAICPHCQADLPPQARFCPGCGAKVD
ncbi:MAG: zinc ribbon domain-containing protein [Thermodesulfobacteriota bacterium]